MALAQGWRRLSRIWLQVLAGLILVGLLIWPCKLLLCWLWLLPVDEMTRLKDLGTFFGGALLLWGLYISNMRATASAHAARAATRVAKANEDGQVTERFSRAIDQLASEKLTIRLGGVYALERVSWQSAEDRPAVMDVLCAFLREDVPDFEGDGIRLGKDRLSTDRQAAFEVVARRNESPFEEGRQNDSLPTCNLNLMRSSLRLASAPKNANFCNANLNRTDLSGADLSSADLSGAWLNGASLVGAELTHAILAGASFVEAVLVEADLTGANLTEADLSGANLTKAIGIDQEMLARTRGDYRTKVPQGLEHPTSWGTRDHRIYQAGLTSLPDYLDPEGKRVVASPVWTEGLEYLLEQAAEVSDKSERRAHIGSLACELRILQPQIRSQLRFAVLAARERGLIDDYEAADLSNALD